MRINSRQLLNLPVVTESGQDLGKIGSFDVDADSGKLISIYVKTRGLVKGLLDQDLLVDWSQVVNVGEDRMVVRDASVPEGAQVVAARAAGSASAPSGAFFMEGEPGEE